MIVQFGGSLIAILALAGLAVLLKLGGKPTLRNASDVSRAADEVHDGFEVIRSAISSEGKAALARSQSGQIILLKQHGNKFAGRLLAPSASVKEEVDALIVDPGEDQFGSVRLRLSDASYWADAITRL